MANNITTKQLALTSLVASESAGQAIHTITKGSNPASNCIVVWSAGDGANNSYWHEAETASLFDDVLYHATEHDTDIVFLRDPSIEDNWFFGGNLKDESGKTLSEFTKNNEGYLDTLHSALTAINTTYASGKVVYLGTGPIASFAAAWHSVLGEAVDDTSLCTPDSLIAWGPQSNLFHLADTIGDTCQLNPAPIITKIKGLDLYGDNWPTQNPEQPALGMGWVENTAWPTEVCKLGYWGPGDPPPCDDDDYYYYHYENFTHGDHGFDKFAAITFDADMEITWLGDIRTALNVTI